MHNIKKVFLVLGTFVACTNAQAIDLITTGDTTLSIGGYIKAQGIFISPDEGDSDFEGSLRESRINVKTTKTVGDKKLTGFVEGDFYGDYIGLDSGAPELRLRQAFIQIDSLTVGKTWNGQALAVAPLLTEQFDFFGAGMGTIGGGGVYARPDLVVHYADKGFRLTAQDPIYDDASLPDMVASYSNIISNFGYNVAVTGREAENGADSDYGLGISLAGKMTIGDGSLHASAYSGEGMGAYSGICVGGSFVMISIQGLECEAENGKLISQTGYNVGYRHKFTEKLRGNFSYGEVNVDDVADTSVSLTTANLIYEYLPDLDLGIEWRNLNETTVPWREKGQQVEVMAKYRF